MKNPLFRTIGVTLVALLFAAAIAEIPVSGQDKGGVKLKNSEQYAKNIEGSWDVLATRLDCQTGAILGTFPAMFTFSTGGTFWEAGTNTLPSLRTASHGVWERDSPGVYTTAFQFFRFNANGTLAGRAV